MSYEKGKFRYSFFILLNDMNVLPQNWQIFIFYNPSLFERAIISKSPYLTATETGFIGRFSEKTQRCIHDHRNI